MQVLDESVNGAFEATATAANRDGGEVDGGGDGDGGSFFSFGEDLEEEFGGVLVEADVAEFVDGEEVVAAVAGNDS